MGILNILTNLCVIRQKNKNKKPFACVVYNFLVLSEFW